jgi:hypothetical protein
MAASALGRDAEPSAGRVVVEVIVSLNHFTELATGATATGGKRAASTCEAASLLQYSFHDGS